MIEFILQNAISTVRIDGVVDPFLTPLGNVAGQFYTGYDFYDFEIEGDRVYYTPAYRADAAKGKKCPGGYWIPRNKDCKKGAMTPSAKGKMGGVKAALAAGLAAGAVGLAGVGAVKAGQVIKKRKEEEDLLINDVSKEYPNMFQGTQSQKRRHARAGINNKKQELRQMEREGERAVTESRRMAKSDKELQAIDAIYNQGKENIRKAREENYKYGVR